MQAQRDGSLVVESVMSHDADNKAVLKTFPFSAKGDARSGRDAAPCIGDVVEFSVSTDRVRDVKRATDIEVIAKASSETALEGLKLVRSHFLVDLNMT